MPIVVEQADLNNDSHQRHILELLEMYSRDPMGNAAPLPASTREQLIEGLIRQTGSLVLLARDDSNYIGLCICFTGFSTFKARTLLNVHDIAVHPDFRSQGVGRRLLEAVEAAARAKNCCKITLEVREDNPAAQHLYQAFGFRDTEPRMFFRQKLLDA